MEKLYIPMTQHDDHCEITIPPNIYFGQLYLALFDSIHEFSSSSGCNVIWQDITTLTKEYLDEISGSSLAGIQLCTQSYNMIVPFIDGKLGISDNIPDYIIYNDLEFNREKHTLRELIDNNTIKHEINELEMNGIEYLVFRQFQEQYGFNSGSFIANFDKTNGAFGMGMCRNRNYPTFPVYSMSVEIVYLSNDGSKLYYLMDNGVVYSYTLNMM